MKKSALVLAILGGFAGSAMAQSSVNLYGIVDVGYGVSNGGVLEGDNGRDGKFQQWGNAYTTSRWGLKGSEDLGNGLNIYFRLESGINPENGSSNGFNRQAYVGVSGNFGSIQAGRQSAVFDDVIFDFSPIGDPNITSANINAGVSSGQRVNRYNSALTYISPDLSGFNFRASFVSKNDDAGVNNMDDKNLFAVGGSYNWNNFTIGAAYESKLNSDTDASWGVGLKYDFGSFLVGGGYTDNHYKEDGKGYYLGVTVPVGAFTFGAQVAYNTSALKGTEERFQWFPTSTGSFDYFTYEVDRKIKPFAYEFLVTYDLSKRTSLYLLAGGINSDAKEFADAKRKYSAAFGLTHRF